MLQDANQPILARYLASLRNNATMPKMLQLRLHFDKKTWNSGDAKINALRASIQAKNDICKGTLNILLPENLSPASRPLNGEDPEVVARRFEGEFNETLQDMLLLHRLVGMDIQHFQHITFQYLQQPQETKDVLAPRYIVPLRTRLLNVYRATLVHIIDLLEQIREQVGDTNARLATLGLWVASDVHNMTARLNQDLNHITELSRMEGPNITFSMTQADQVSDDQRLESLAIRDMSLLPDNGVLLGLVRKYIRIVGTHKLVQPAPANALERANKIRADRQSRTAFAALDQQVDAIQGFKRKRAPGDDLEP